MKKTITTRTLFIYLALIVALFIAYGKTHAQQAAWKPNPKYIKTRTDSTRQAKKYQCTGTTQAGNQCKYKSNKPNFRCHWHINQK